MDPIILTVLWRLNSCMDFFFQKCSDAIRYIMKGFGYLNMLNYIDDLIYISLPSNIESSYRFLLKLLQEHG